MTHHLRFGAMLLLAPLFAAIWSLLFWYRATRSMYRSEFVVWRLRNDARAAVRNAGTP